jgi:CRP/FNR family transcriptional regulator, cyclic AMP receptor protein
MTAVEHFSNIPLFQGLALEERRRLFFSARRQSLKKGDVLFRKGSEGTTLYVIHKGRIKISVTSNTGDEVILAFFSEGDYFGEMALLDGMTRSADAMAVEPTELFALNQKDFTAFLQQNTSAILAVLKALSLRLRKTDDLLEDTCFLNISARFAKKLIELAELHGRPVDGAIQIEISFSQREFAGMIGASRESINKELRILKEKGLVTIMENKVYIHNLERLKKRTRRTK